MTTRSILAAAAIAAGLATPAAAQDGRTFKAWGHTFDVPNPSIGRGAVAAPEQSEYRDDQFAAPKRSYVSGRVDTAAQNEALVPATTSRVINVWGARIEVPAR